MANGYSTDDLLEFLDHAGDKGLMPAATAQALAVATRNVLAILSEQEKADLSQLDLDTAIKRFTNKRAKDFNPTSLKEYGRRVRRAVELFLNWREDPANFTIKTRTTSAPRKKDKGSVNNEPVARDADQYSERPHQRRGGANRRLRQDAGPQVMQFDVPRFQ
jgi:hypothetical protein